MNPCPVTIGSQDQLSWNFILLGAMMASFFLSQYADVVGPHWHLDYHLILFCIVAFFDAVVRTTALFTNDVNS